MTNKKNLELYIHLPFCVKKCAYCDFLSFPMEKKQQRAYVDALLREIAAAAEQISEQYEVSTVFFGGGTPSVLPAEWIGEILKSLKAHFYFSEKTEISIEANPGTVTAEALRSYQVSGINRISLGCQSTQDAELLKLGRIHSYAQFLESYQLARKAGFSNINVDLMSAIPGQTPKSWAENLERILALRPEHISAYSLIVEEGTPFASMKLALPSEDEERQMYEYTFERLKQAGFVQYEISNYAREGFACRHNIGYWERTEYLGLGLGASSLIDETRFSNTDEWNIYLTHSAELHKIREQVEKLSRNDQMAEMMFLGLRMTEGVSKERFLEKFGTKLEEVYSAVLEKYQNMGLLLEKDGRICLSREGISVSNRIMADFLLD